MTMLSATIAVPEIFAPQGRSTEDSYLLVVQYAAEPTHVFRCLTTAIVMTRDSCSDP